MQNLDIQLLSEWNPTHTWDLQPGDMLYVPPNCGHEGVAVDAGKHCLVLVLTLLRTATCAHLHCNAFLASSASTSRPVRAA